MAIVYSDRQVSLFRNGAPYASYPAANIDLLSSAGAHVVFGLRHIGARESQTFQGTIEDARIYDRALSADELKSLRPNLPSKIKPYAWWTFENGDGTDLMGRFPSNHFSGGARVEGGRLVLDSPGAALEAAARPGSRSALSTTPGPVFGRKAALPELNYHAEGMYHWDTWYMPLGDTVHMFHLQVLRPGSQRPGEDDCTIGHAVTRDLLHWQELPVALHKGASETYDDGCLFTGYAIEHEGGIFLFYCSNHDAGGRVRQAMCLATSKDGGLTFEKYPGNPIIEPDPARYYALSEPPAAFSHHAHPHIDCRDLAIIKDPSGNGWLGYVVMRRKGQPDAFHSACVALCRSKDLVHWAVGDPCCTPNRFNCFEVPDVFQLGDKWFMIALTGDAYGQSQRWSDPTITCGTVVFQSDRPEGPFEEVKDNLLLASKRNVWQGFSARTVLFKGERLMLFTRCEGINGRGSLAWPVRLVPRTKGGLDPVYWSGIDAAFEPASRLPARGRNSADPAFMVTVSVNLRTAMAAGICFGNHAAVIDSSGKVLLVDIASSAVVQDRDWPIATSRANNLRLVVVDGMVDIYVNDVLAMDYYLADPGEGGVRLFSRGGSAQFNSAEYRVAKTRTE